MTLGQLKIAAVKLIDEYSNNDDITDDEDIKLKLNDLFNLAQHKVMQHSKIRKMFSVTQNLPINNVEQRLNHIYSHDSKDIIFKAIGKSYHFMVQGEGTAIISQNGMDEIEESFSTGDNFERFKGITTGEGLITIRFTGDYFYNIKNIAIWNVSFSDEDVIPDYETEIEYNVPDDFYRLKNVVFKGTTNEFKEYRFINRKIVINAYNRGEYEIYYNAYPTEITEETEDSYEFEFELEAQTILSWYVASAILMSDVSANYTVFEAKFQEELQTLIRNEEQEESITIRQIIGNL